MLRYFKIDVEIFQKRNSAMTKTIEYQDALIKKFGYENASIFYEYEDSVNVQNVIIKDELYKSGFIDRIPF